jgi:hypothetical protein
MFLLMRQQMIDIATEIVHESEPPPKPVPEIWNHELVKHIDSIYENTLRPVIAQDGLFTKDYLKAWSDYRLQVAEYMLRVFGTEKDIGESSTAFGRASSWMQSNLLRILPETVSKVQLPWPILTSTVMKDFTVLFKKVELGIGLVCYI